MSGKPNGQPTPGTFALVGWYESPADLYHACETLRDANLSTAIDAHTPFPVHGLERAMGLPPSKLGWICLCAGILGAITGFSLQTWVHLYAYPQVIGGKALFSFPEMIPILFELTVLFASFGAFFGMWGLNKLPQHFHPVMQHPTFDRFSDDRFFLSVESKGGRTDLVKARELLEKTGAQEITEVMP